MKDLFSGHAKCYASFRPDYPDALFAFLYEHVENKNEAWDCGTGNGQVAKVLAKTFQHVSATDISASQLNNAVRASNINYLVSPAEQTPFDDHQFDLVTVGQALHWFELDKFYREVKRVSKRGALVAAWGYGLLEITPQLDEQILEFYRSVVGPYWDPARKLVEDRYACVPFPFEEIKPPAFAIHQVWTIETLEGYLTSWSATQKYIRENRQNPVTEFIKSLKPGWSGDGEMSVNFPLFMRVGRV